MVHFDDEQKIVQIRLYWDQGSLLRQVDVIGARSRNWPIRDGKEQGRLIATSSATVAQPPSAPSSRPSTAARGPDEVSVTARSRRSTNNAMNDPHATLSLFQPRDLGEDAEPVSRPIAPRAQSAKPPPREYSELFVGQDPPSPSPADAGASPQKHGIPTKSGGGKNFKPSRLFEEAEGEEATPTPMSVKTNAKKYNHFDFGEGDEDSTPKVREALRPAAKSKHMSHWDFEDIDTSDKVKPKVLGQAVRHFGWSDDEVGLFYKPELSEVASISRRSEQTCANLHPFRTRALQCAVP